MKNTRISSKQYIPEDPLEVLNAHESQEVFREVLYTFGTEEIVKDNGKYYLSSTIYPVKNKEITKAMATELWQGYNMKSRSDISINFDL